METRRITVLSAGLGVPSSSRLLADQLAGAAQWLISTGRAPTSYVASQGTVLGRKGRVHIDAAGGDVWVGGSAVTCIRGATDL